MTKKKTRARLARALRVQGIKGARAFAVAKAVVKAGSPAQLSAPTLAALGLASTPGTYCTVRFSHTNTEVFCATTGACVVSAWHALCAIA